MKNNLLKITLGIGILMSLFSCFENSRFSRDKGMIESRKREVAAILQSNLPLITLEDHELLDKESQIKLMTDVKLTSLFFEPNTKGPLLNEVLSISKTRPSDITNKTAVCKSKDCYRMEVYNFALNGTLIATILKDSKRMVDFVYYPEMQGDLNDKLAKLAVQIAIEDEMVAEEFGRKPKFEDSVMQGTKTALNRTKCQRSKHFCAAPTFVKGDKALWAIVDLTELRVSGVEWTDVGRTGMPVTERSAQNNSVMQSLCDIENVLERDQWNIKYNLTRSDGLKVYNVTYKGEPLIKSIKTVDWHVSYSERKGFGYSDAIGCPEFSMAAVVAIEAPYQRALVENGDTVGFALVQKYFSEGWPTPCSYNYQQEFHFFKDGSFRPVVGSLGRGCGTDGTYRPVTRIALEGKRHEFFVPQNKDWSLWEKEQWVKENETYKYMEGRFLAKWNLNNEKEFWIESNQGQFNDGGRGDLAYFYVSVDHPDKTEGEADLPTIGPCCNRDYRQGPEKFLNNESLIDNALVFWYVPEIKNDGRKGTEYCWAESVLENGVYVAKVYPCFSGPKFHLRKIQI